MVLIAGGASTTEYGRAVTSLAPLTRLSWEEVLVSCDTGLFPLSCESLLLLVSETGRADEGPWISETGRKPLFGLDGDTGLMLCRTST